MTDFHLADYLDDEEDVAMMLELQDDEGRTASIEAAATQARARWAAAAANPDLTPAQLAAISDAVREGQRGHVRGTAGLSWAERRERSRARRSRMSM